METLQHYISLWRYLGCKIKGHMSKRSIGSHSLDRGKRVPVCGLCLAVYEIAQQTALFHTDALVGKKRDLYCAVIICLTLDPLYDT